MNYSTIKKVVAYSLVSVLGLSASAQTATTATPAKTFGGTGQYRTWSVGLNVGALSPTIALGGSNDFATKRVTVGGGLTVRKQFAHSFGAELGVLGGTLKGLNETTKGVKYFKPGQLPGIEYHSFDTRFLATSVMAVVNVATVDFLQRENAVNFVIKGGYGVSWYYFNDVVQYPVLTNEERVYPSIAPGKPNPIFPYNDHVVEQFFPVGVGAKWKLSDKINFDLGYTMYFLDGDNLDGNYDKFNSKDKWSYGYAGLEFSLGSTSKPDLTWANPVAIMYDELKDPTLRQEVEALKGRVSTLENTVNQLSADSDGDGVSNKFDKCPNTPAGTQVDGSGCPIKFPEPAPVVSVAAFPASSVIQFEFDSSVLKTSSYPVLDQISAALKGNSTSITLEGYASAEGTDEYNMRLSNDRANSVKTYLVNSGVDASRIATKALGEANPVASNATEEGRIQNRRVEIKK